MNKLTSIDPTALAGVLGGNAVVAAAVSAAAGLFGSGFQVNTNTNTQGPVIQNTGSGNQTVTRP